MVLAIEMGVAFVLLTAILVALYVAWQNVKFIGDRLKKKQVVKRLVASGAAIILAVVVAIGTMVPAFAATEDWINEVLSLVDSGLHQLLIAMILLCVAGGMCLVGKLCAYSERDALSIVLLAIATVASIVGIGLGAHGVASVLTAWLHCPSSTTTTFVPIPFFIFR